MTRPGLAAFVLGALCVLGFAPFGVLPAPTLALAGLFLLWRRAPTACVATWLGFAWGAGCFLAGVSWVYVSLSEFSGMAAPLAALATLLFCLYLAGFPALAGALFVRWRTGHWRDALLFGGLWMLAEWLRGTLLTGFPWLAVGYAHGPPSPLAGFAPAIGVYGIGLLVAISAALIANAWRRPAGWVLLVALLAAGQLLRAMDWTQPAGPPLTVALLQGNVPQSMKWDPQRLPRSVGTYVDLAGRQPADLIVLPETAIPLFFDEIPREVLQSLTRRGPALIGVAVGTREGGYTNAAVALTPTLAATAYAKRHLVPFGEYAPPGFAWFFRLARIPLSDFTAGPANQAPLTVAGQRISPNICYEDLFGEELLGSLAQATLLINLSNTAWFGDSLAQPQHLQIAQLRALETGRTMLRATNTGMTAMVLPDGRVAAALAPFSTGVLRVEAQGYTGLTPYARWGNALALLLALFAVLPAWRVARRRKTQIL